MSIHGNRKVGCVMSMSHGWEWLDDLPDEWEAPSDLQSPTPYPEVNVAIQILSCDFLGFDVRAAIGHFIAEEALYDMWFVENVEADGWGGKKAALLREVPMEQTRIVYESWKTLDAVSEIDAPNDVVRERRVTAIAELKAALQRAAEEFERIRTENSAG
ncbi:hypothetical protein ACIG63_06110 [Streptomyces antimycoticus]|uniref:hypothetical protein n=1 Tax=Streptomyces antimycoticus TaxID=68175 RepID=UPI0037CFFC12